MSNSVEQMREALKAVIEYSNLVLKSGMFHRQHLEQIVKKCENAVSTPLRNCDVANDWIQDLYVNFKPPKSVRREMPPEWVDAVMCFCKWILSNADEGCKE